MIWLIDLCSSFMNVVNHLFYFISTPINDVLTNLNVPLTIPYFGEMSFITLLTAYLVVFLIISFVLRLIHG